MDSELNAIGTEIGTEKSPGIEEKAWDGLLKEHPQRSFKATQTYKYADELLLY